MSKYTSQLRFICESLAGLNNSGGYNSINTIINAARPKLFDFPYPIYDESYRSVLETKFIKHFYTREICETTYGLWKLRLDEKMNLTMSYYNELYKSLLLKFDPLLDVDYKVKREVTYKGDKTNNATDTTTRIGSGKTEGTAENNSTTSTEMWNKYSDTPQGGLTGIETDTYLTNATNETNDSTAVDNNKTNTSYSDNESTAKDSEQTEKYTNTDDYLEHVTGKQGGKSFPELIADFRKNLINVDEMLFDELENLFMGLW